MTVKQIAKLDGLNDFLKSQPHSELLQSPLWGKVQQAAGRPSFLFGMFDDYELTASCLIIKHQLPLGKSWLYSPRLNWPLDYMPQLIDEIAKIAKKENAIFWKAENIKNQIRNTKYEIRNTNPLQPQETFIINLTQSDDQLLKNMKPKTRYNIRLAQKKGVKTRWSTDAADINVFYDLLTSTARRQKIKIHPKSHYQNILKILSDQNAAALAIAEVDSNSKPLAANLITFFGDTATYLHGGTSDARRSLMAPYLLQWEAIKEARRRGCKFYDMGGCAVKTGKIDLWAGISRFKTGFNGELTQFGPTYDVVFNRAWHLGLLIARKLL
ncbi:MAG: peptidoglycan bridge formation glycyltransferase FemA/FemB family protein [Patescibacteria group bacterium]|mgnify:CR=1 FL=1